MGAQPVGNVVGGSSKRLPKVATQRPTAFGAAMLIAGPDSVNILCEPAPALHSAAPETFERMRDSLHCAA